MLGSVQNWASKFKRQEPKRKDRLEGQLRKSWYASHAGNADCLVKGVTRLTLELTHILKERLYSPASGTRRCTRMPCFSMSCTKRDK